VKFNWALSWTRNTMGLWLAASRVCAKCGPQTAWCVTSSVANRQYGNNPTSDCPRVCHIASAVACCLGGDGAGSMEEVSSLRGSWQFGLWQEFAEASRGNLRPVPLAEEKTRRLYFFYQKDRLLSLDPVLVESLLARVHRFSIATWHEDEVRSIPASFVHVPDEYAMELGEHQLRIIGAFLDDCFPDSGPWVEKWEWGWCNTNRDEACVTFACILCKQPHVPDDMPMDHMFLLIRKEVPKPRHHPR